MASWTKFVAHSDGVVVFLLMAAKRTSVSEGKRVVKGFEPSSFPICTLLLAVR